MKSILIICAMEVEQKYIIESLADKQEIILLNQAVLTQGLYCGCRVHVVLSGIGKVNAGISTVLAVKEVSPSLIINSGVAGGLSQKQKQGDIIIGTSVMYHDVDVRSFGYKLGQIPNLPEKFPTDQETTNALLKIAGQNNIRAILGNIISGDQFIGEDLTLETLNKNFPSAIAVEMEAAAIGHVAYLSNIPFVIIRAISDKADGKAKLSYEDFLELSAKKSSTLLLEFLKQ